MRIAIFENEFLSCDLDDSLPVLCHKWKFEVSGDVFRINLLRVLSEYQILSKTYSRLAWLADTTYLGELDEAVDNWLVTEWEDHLFRKAGVKIHTVILGSSIFADYPMEKFKLDSEEKFRAYNVHLGVFSHEKEAYDWIRQQQLAL